MSSTTYQIYAKNKQIYRKVSIICTLSVRISRFQHKFTAMVRNAGQLPQPFWLGAACGGGSCSLSASVARA
jgi:hypothetical protein